VGSKFSLERRLPTSCQKKFLKLVRKAQSVRRTNNIVHGETIAEPVAQEQTRRLSAISDVNIIATHGLVSQEDVELANQNGIYLELTARCGHNATNGHVAKLPRISLLTQTCHGTELITNVED